MLTQYFLDKLVDDEYVAVSPDAGRAKLAEKFAGELGVRPAFLTKNRPEHNIAEAGYVVGDVAGKTAIDRKSTRLNSSHMSISYAVFCLKKKRPTRRRTSGSAAACRRARRATCRTT